MSSPQGPARPAPSAPLSTYRLQLRTEFGFDDAAGVADYLAALGISHAYLSPILRAVPGSPHGYDVIDHSQLSPDAGGDVAFGRLSTALAEHGLHAVADVVPNHMAVPTPARLNAPLWGLLRDGPESPYAAWFDIDWTPRGNDHGQLLMPVLGGPIGDVVRDGELSVDSSGPEPVLRYYEHEFPLRPGTSELELEQLLGRQWYRLAWWRVGAQELNYRRFFDVTSLIAIRVEEPEVFHASHELLQKLLAEGTLTGLRIDHPDGLADPRKYLRDLAGATGDTWVVVEKILEGDEALPRDWPCAGTTGYDALNKVQGLFVDPAGELPLTRLAEPDGAEEDHLERMLTSAKFAVLDTVLQPEIDRLLDLLVQICAADLDLRDNTRDSLSQALTHLLVSMDRYRAYTVPDSPPPAEAVRVLDAAAGRAAMELDVMGEQPLAALHAVHELALDTTSPDPLRQEFVIRFAQTCGPVMAKGIEDTLFYRSTRLLALNEVGADPHAFGCSPGDFHDFAGQLQRDWPHTLTTLSTHDTKRSEDARARLLAISEVPGEWARVVLEWEELAERHRDEGWPAGQSRYLLWQSLVAIWGPVGPPDVERVLAYVEKADREAKVWTTWTSPDSAYEDAAASFVQGVLADLDLVASIGGFVERLAAADRVNLLGQKLIQLTMPGVPDIYQGCEIVDRSLVDPDNRRPVDYPRRRRLLTALDDGTAPADLPGADRLDAEKLLVTSRALRLRQRLPEAFRGAYVPWASGSRHSVAFGRGGSGAPENVLTLTVATRLAIGLAENGEPNGGWDDASLTLPPGDWRDELTGRTFSGPSVRYPELLDTYPVALLART